nr:MAG TPA: hypothetical protein [Caudoviricetes sp.]
MLLLIPYKISCFVLFSIIYITKAGEYSKY